MDQVKFVEDSPWEMWSDMVCLGRPYHFRFFKGCLPQIILGPFLNTLTHLRHCQLSTMKLFYKKAVNWFTKSSVIYVWQGPPYASDLYHSFFRKWPEMVSPSHLDPGRREKINLNSYFHPSLWGGESKKKCMLIFILRQLSKMHRAGRVKAKLLYNLQTTWKKSFPVKVKITSPMRDTCSELP